MCTIFFLLQCGYDKRKILVIDKTKNLWCFNKVTFLVEYWNNKKACVTSEIISKWFENIGNEITK